MYYFLCRKHNSRKGDHKHRSRLFVNKFHNPLSQNQIQLTINRLEAENEKSGTFRVEKYRFSMRKVPLFPLKSTALCLAEGRM